jgi:hypothetical protein
MVLMIDRMGTDIELHQPHQEDEREAERERENVLMNRRMMTINRITNSLTKN